MLRPRYRLKKETFRACKTARLSHEIGSYQTFRIGCDIFAIEPVTLFIRKREHRDGDIGWSVVAEAREARAHFVWISPWYEISMMSAVRLEASRCVRKLQLRRVGRDRACTESGRSLADEWTLRFSLYIPFGMGYAKSRLLQLG